MYIFEMIDDYINNHDKRKRETKSMIKIKKRINNFIEQYYIMYHKGYDPKLIAFDISGWLSCYFSIDTNKFIDDLMFYAENNYNKNETNEYFNKISSDCLLLK